MVQFPNAPLIVAFLAGRVAVRLHGQGHSDAPAISYLALTVWAYAELVHGVNWFRHLLGLACVVSAVVHQAVALAPLIAAGLASLSRAARQVGAYPPLMSGSGEFDGSLHERVDGHAAGELQT